MPDLNDFYAFKMTTSGGGANGGKRNNSNDGNSGSNDCSTALIVFAVIGWGLFLISK